MLDRPVAARIGAFCDAVRGNMHEDALAVFMQDVMGVNAQEGVVGPDQAPLTGQALHSRFQEMAIRTVDQVARHELHSPQTIYQALHRLPPEESAVKEALTQLHAHMRFLRRYLPRKEYSLKA